MCRCCCFVLLSAAVVERRREKEELVRRWRYFWLNRNYGPKCVEEVRRRSSFESGRGQGAPISEIGGLGN